MKDRHSFTALQGTGSARAMYNAIGLKSIDPYRDRALVEFELFVDALTGPARPVVATLLHRPQIVERGWVSRDWPSRELEAGPSWTNHGDPLVQISTTTRIVSTWHSSELSSAPTALGLESQQIRKLV